jgi:hypothetical protein
MTKPADPLVCPKCPKCGNQALTKFRALYGVTRAEVNGKPKRVETYIGLLCETCGTVS